MLAPLRLLFVLAAVAQAETGAVAREVEAICRDGDVCRDALRRQPAWLVCAEEEEDEGKTWAFDLTGYWTDPPEADAYGSAILRADRGPLHLEARYNYEGIDTGSVFAGWTFVVGGRRVLARPHARRGLRPHTGGRAGPRARPHVEDPRVLRRGGVRVRPRRDGRQRARARG